MKDDIFLIFVNELFCYNTKLFIISHRVTILHAGQCLEVKTDFLF